MAKQLSDEQVMAVKRVRLLLEGMNAQLQRGEVILSNGRMVTAIETLDVAFQKEFGIGS